MYAPISSSTVNNLVCIIHQLAVIRLSCSNRDTYLCVVVDVYRPTRDNLAYRVVRLGVGVFSIAARVAISPTQCENEKIKLQDDLRYFERWYRPRRKPILEENGLANFPKSRLRISFGRIQVGSRIVTAYGPYDGNLLVLAIAVAVVVVVVHEE